MGRIDPDSELAAEIERLRGLYIASLPQMRLDILDCWQQLVSAPPEPALGQDLVRLAHRLAGTAAMYRLPELGQSARAFEQSLAKALADDGEAWERHRGSAGQKLDQLSAHLQRVCQEAGLHEYRNRTN